MCFVDYSFEIFLATTLFYINKHCRFKIENSKKSSAGRFSKAKANLWSMLLELPTRTLSLTCSISGSNGTCLLITERASSDRNKTSSLLVHPFYVACKLCMVVLLLKKVEAELDLKPAVKKALLISVL